MMNKQTVLDHCKRYFLSRITNHRGVCGSGWENCALGTMVEGYVRSVREEIERLVGSPFTEWPVGSFYKSITTFNDHNMSKNHPLTVADVDLFLSQLAAKYDLNYDPINEANTPIFIESDDDLSKLKLKLKGSANDIQENIS